MVKPTSLSLFYQVSEESCQQMLQCLKASKRRFTANEIICQFGQDLQSVGMITSGNASIIRYETSGTRTILERLEKYDLFGEKIAFQAADFETIYMVCEKDCEVIFLNYQHISQPCVPVCDNHCQLIQNIFTIFSAKLFYYSQRIELLSKRSIRDKLIYYFYQLTSKAGSCRATIPFTMSDLADYLSVDRSAMTRELKKMKEEGLIQLKKHTVTLNAPDSNLI